jgi:hypothetical protein
MFAIASMAQTRALGKAYRMGLSWIMKMAGFEGTFAEDMPKFKPQSRPINNGRRAEPDEEDEVVIDV